MARRSFRYDSALQQLVEITRTPDELHAVHGDDGFVPFRSVVDGTYIDSRSAYKRHVERHGLVAQPDLAGNKPVSDRYARDRNDRALRERLWEGVSKTFSMSDKARR